MSTGSESNTDADPVPANVLRVLIVDDDALERELYCQYLDLAEDTRYVLSEAETGAEGLERCDRSEHDCVLLDYSLPDTDGLQLIGKLRGRVGGHVPIILMTGVGNERIAADMLKAGAADYLPKADISADLLTRAIDGAVEKARLREEIDEQVRHIRRQNEELQRKQEEIQRFYQNVSHELKTPLTSMQEFASLIIDGLAGPINDEQRQYVGLIHESCVELTTEINALLELSRLEADEYRLDSRPFDIGAVVDRLLRYHETRARAKSVTVTHEPEGTPGKVYADPSRCTQILSNLLSNAIKFTGTNGEIRVLVRDSNSLPDHVTVAVVDSGCGIEKAELERIFERLYQAEPSDSHTGSHADDGSSTSGLGLGLTIARRLVEIQGGRLWVESEVGVGSTFAFALPSHGTRDDPSDTTNA